MYSIYKLENGKYECHCRLQDSTERFTENTLEEAIDRVKRFALHCNGEKIKRKHICYYEPIQIVKTEWKECEIPHNPKK